MNIKRKTSKKSSSSTFNAADELVSVPGYSRRVRAKVAARLYRLQARRVKGMLAEIEALKCALRDTGKEVMDTNAQSGVYIANVDLGGVHIGRANKFAPIDVDRRQLIDCVGETEYRLMFNEQAVLKFDSADNMERFVSSCNEAGIELHATADVRINGNARLAESLCKTRSHLKPEVVEILESCAIDQQPRVVVK